MPYLQRAVAPAEVAKRLESLGPLPAGVVKLRFTLEDDWTGDPAIFFWVTLSDEATDLGVLDENTDRVRSLIKEQLDPVGKWGLYPYIHFRSQSEQAKLKDAVFG